MTFLIAFIVMSHKAMMKMNRFLINIAKLPAELLHILGIGTVIELCHLQQVLRKEYSKETIEEMLLRSWKAISANQE